nr:nucleolar GTP-binding protein 1-like [Tanacetum cinerariifolium]
MVKELHELNKPFEQKPRFRKKIMKLEDEKQAAQKEMDRLQAEIQNLSATLEGQTQKLQDMHSYKLKSLDTLMLQLAHLVEMEVKHDAIRIKKSTAESQQIVPRKHDKEKKFTSERMGRQLLDLGLEPSKALDRVRSKSRGRKRERSSDHGGDDRMWITMLRNRSNNYHFFFGSMEDRVVHHSLMEPYKAWYLKAVARSLLALPVGRSSRHLELFALGAPVGTRGDYLGKTIQVVPHITDDIQYWIERVAAIHVDGKEGLPNICVIELGGTIESVDG